MDFTLRDDFRVDIDLGNFRSWKEVLMEDNDGVVRKGIFLPYLPNGIKLRRSGMPYMVFKAITPKSGKMQDAAFLYGWVRSLVPCINKDMHERMVDEGILSPDDKDWGFYAGHVRPANYVDVPRVEKEYEQQYGRRV